MRAKYLPDAVLGTSLFAEFIFVALSARESHRVTGLPHTDFVNPGLLFCAIYPITKLVLFVAFLVLERYHVRRRKRQARGRGGIYYRRRGYVVAYWNFVSVTILGSLVAFAPGIVWCTRFGFSPTVIDNAFELAQFSFAHVSVVIGELILFVPTWYLFTAFVLKCWTLEDDGVRSKMM